jgi:CelD/BcsL family acetyltransferase involved in cellulose biosynthesis
VQGVAGSNPAVPTKRYSQLYSSYKDGFLSITTEIIDNSSDLASIANEWNALADPFKTPLLRYEWFNASANAFSSICKLNIIVLRSDGKIIAIAPLVFTKIFGLKRLELLGASVLGEPIGLIYKDTETLTTLINEILHLRKPIFFRGLPSNSLEIDILKRQKKNNLTYTQNGSFAAPWIPILTNWESYYSTVSSRWRSTIRRAERRAKEFGNIKYEVVTPNLETLEKHLDEVFEVEMLSWKSRVGTALKTYSDLGNFFHSYSHATAKLGMLRLAFLRIEDKAVAVQLLIENANRIWVLKIGYDEAYARCSPGILLMHKVIQHAFEKQLEAIELLGTNQSWLNIWPSQLHRFDIYRLYPVTPIAIISCGLEFANAALHKLRTILAKRSKTSNTQTPPNPDS